MKWPHAAPNTRNGINEALTAVTMALLEERPGQPSEELVRRALRTWAIVLPGPDERELPTEIANILHWVSKASRPLMELDDAAIGRAVLDSLKLKLDGTAAAAETVRRNRRTLVNALHYAVDLEEFKENPITGIRWKEAEGCRGSRSPRGRQSRAGSFPADCSLVGRWVRPGAWPPTRRPVRLHVLRRLTPG